METLILLIQEHSNQNLFDDHIKDLIRLGCFLIWLAVLFVPLSGVDREDRFTGLCYGIYLLACAAILVFAIPSDRQSFHESPSEYLIFFILGFLISLRWNARISRFFTSKRNHYSE